MKTRWIVTVLVLLVSTSVRGADLFKKSYAVVIGISSYQNQRAWKTLDNAENDAEAMDDFLAGQGFNVKRFVGPEATKSNIVAYLEDTLAPRLERDDRFVFYFSGHGNTRSLGGSDRGYLIPYDGDTEKSSTWIAMEQLQELADKLGNARHQLFILDSCFGGLFATKGSMSTIPEGTPSYIITVTSNRARQYLTAGGTNEETPASSNLDGYRKYSYYTSYLLKGLREGIADSYPDGYITASELDAYLGPAATTKYNKPRGGNFPGHQQGNFVFLSSKKQIPGVFIVDVTKGGDTKGNDKKKDREEVERLRAEVERLRTAGAAEKAKELEQKQQALQQSVSYSEQQSVQTKKLSKEEQDQALYEWQKDVSYSSSSKTVEDFLRRFPVGSHVPDAQRKLSELRALGQ